ncbi:MAG: hypothetical protein IIB09_03835, partial [Bacteroidetes bacterium]|nr:hypothetical protein [Bacteroidota bacterium]
MTNLVSSLVQTASRRRWTRRVAWELGLPFVFLGAACAASIAAILWRTGGTFVYTLDDAYIRLALAEELARGHYGVNPGSFSAPASSVLWPFLLVPSARLQGAVLVPLVYNLLAAAGTVVVYRQVLIKTFRPSGETKQSVVVGLAGVGLALTTNLVGLVFTGMEHSLQLLLVALAVLWLWEESETGEVSLWLVVVLVLGPLVRYENLALTVPALVYLFSRGHRRIALGAGIALSALLGAFSLFLLGHGVGPLPSSVLAKSSLDDGAGAMLQRVWENLRVGQGRVLAAGLLPLFVVALSKRRDRPAGRFALVLIVAATLHFIGGKFGWQSRYEIYVWAAVLLGLVLLYGDRLRRFDEERGAWVPFQETRVTEDEERIFYVVTPGKFSLWAITGEREAPPVRFRADNLAISSSPTAEGSKVQVQVDVTNLTPSPQEYNAVLWVNAQVSLSQGVLIAPSASETITFTTQLGPGDYTIRVDRLLDGLVIKPDRL